MTNLVKAYEEWVEQFRKEHPDLAEEADEYWKSHPFPTFADSIVKIHEIPRSKGEN